MKPQMHKPGATGIKRLINAFGYSINGFKTAWKTEEAFRIEVVLSIFMLPLGLYLGNGGVEKALLAGAVIIVLLAEAINTAIEAVVDRFGGEHHELSGLAKDLGSLVVLLSLSYASIVWVLVAVPQSFWSNLF